MAPTHAPEQLRFPHFVSAAQVTRPLMELIIRRANDMRRMLQTVDGCTHHWPMTITGEDSVAYHCNLEGRRIAMDQRESSSRTFRSFIFATVNLRGELIPHLQDNSLSKGESLPSHYMTFAGNHPAVVVTRSSGNLDPHRAAWLFESYPGTVPGKQRYGAVISGGDGTNEHPTQAVLDMYTTWQTLGRIDNFTLLITGDLGYSRTINSLLHLICNVCQGVRIKIAMPVVEDIEYGPPEEVLYRLTQAGVAHETVPVSSSHDFELLLTNHDIDIVYSTRPQRERYQAALVSDPDQMVRDIVSCIRITPELLDKSGVRLFHPLPHTDEVADGCDFHPLSMYFKQASNGVPVRMALLQLVLLDLELLQSLGNPVPPFPLGWAAL